MQSLAVVQTIGLEQDAAVALLVGMVAVPLASFVTYLLTRPKQRADVHSSMVTSASTAVDAITDVLLEVRRELEEAREEIAALREENQSLQRMVVDLRQQVQELHYLKSSRD